MTRDEFKTIVFRVNVFGFCLAIPFFLLLTTLSVLLIFSFDVRMMQVYLAGVAVASIILLPPTFIYLYTGFRRVSKTFDEAARAIAGEAGGGSVDLRSIETYPVKMAVLAFVVGTIGGTIGALSFYFLGEYSGTLSVYYVVLTVTAAVSTAYLEYHILYRLMEPLRKDIYTNLGTREASGGVSLKIRILALAAVLTIAPLLFGWVTSVTRTTFIVRDNSMLRCSDNTALLADDIAGEVSDGDQAPAKDKVGQFSMSEDANFVILDQGGQPVSSFAMGEEVDSETRDKLMSELAKQEGGAVVNRRMTWVAAEAPIGDTGYTLVQMVPIETLQGEVWNIGFLFFLIALLVVSIAGTLTWLTYDSITRPIEELGEVATRVSEGDLTVHPSVASSDETGKLSEIFSMMVDNLRQVSMETMEAAGHASEGASGVSATAEEIQASLEQLTTIIMQLARNAEVEAETADRVNELTREIFAALQASSDQAESGMELSQTSSQLAEAGRKDALNAVERMSQARDSIQDTAGIIETLGQRSEEIGVIIEIIDNIADQTNLLALNAAIEAARAQEHGRGFSVVAEEVRKLAEESSASTSRISGLVREIQKLAVNAVDATHRGTEEVAMGMKAVQVTGESLQKIFEFVQRSEELSRAISETAQHHLELGGKVMEAVHEIHSIADANASSSEEISASAEEQTASMQELASTSLELSAMAERLRKLVEQFHI
jgi:methyl-accepting chemotaxis protein